MPATEISYPEDQMVIKREEYDLWDLAHVSIRPTKLSIPDYYREILKAYNSILFQPKVLWMYIKTYSIKKLEQKNNESENKRYTRIDFLIYNQNLF